MSYNLTRHVQQASDKRVMITPQIAQQILDLTNTDNYRDLNSDHVRVLADLMEKGSFDFNGDSIKIDLNGVLADGQHRCHAGIRADKPFMALISTGLPAAAADTLDFGGRKRSLGDFFKRKGVNNAAKISAAIVAYYDYTELKVMVGSLNRRGMSKADLYEYYLKHETGLQRSGSKFFNGLETPPVLSANFLVAYHYVASQIDEGLADHFFHSVGHSLELVKNSPAHKFRAILNHNRNRPRKLGTTQKIVLLVKAWNATREGRSMGYVKILSGETNAKMR